MGADGPGDTAARALTVGRSVTHCQVISIPLVSARPCCKIVCGMINCTVDFSSFPFVCCTCDSLRLRVASSSALFFLRVEASSAVPAHVHAFFYQGRASQLL